MTAVILETWFLVSFLGSGPPDAFRTLLGIGALAPIAGLVFLLFPVQAILATPLLILIPLQFMGVFAFEWVFICALFAFTLRHPISNPLRVSLRAMDAVFVVYLLWGFLATTQAANLKLALAGLKPPVIFFLAYLVGSRILGPRRLPALIHIYALVAVGVAIEIVVTAIAKGIPLALVAIRLGSLTDLGWGRSNYVAAVAALAAAAVFPAVLFRKGRDRHVAAAGILAAAYVAYASASRGGTVALLLSLILGMAVARMNLKPALAALGAILALFILSPFGQDIIADFVRPKGLPSIGARLLFFGEAWRIAVAHPIFGVGPDQIPFHTFFYMDPNPHNIFLKQAADLGFVGLGLYMLLLGMVGKCLLEIRPPTGQSPGRFQFLVLCLVFCTALINSSYEPTLEGPQYGFLFWLMVGVLVSPPTETVDGPAR